ncbi:hypothetical protein HYY75_09725 [bacterium]|nr:hypothetical protein [bacterium]
MAQRVMEAMKTYDFDHLSLAQWKDNKDQQKRTLEWDLQNDTVSVTDKTGKTDQVTRIGDRIKVSERINNVVYEIKDSKVEMDDDKDPNLALISFSINFKGKRNGKEKEFYLPIKTALARAGMK